MPTTTKKAPTPQRKPPPIEGGNVQYHSMLSPVQDTDNALPVPQLNSSLGQNLDEGNMTIDSVYGVSQNGQPVSNNNASAPVDYFNHHENRSQEPLSKTKTPVSNLQKDSLDLTKDPSRISIDSKHEKRFKKSDSNGFISSIINAAHNVMSPSADDSESKKELQSTHSKEKDSSFSHKLEFLLKPIGKDSASKSSFEEREVEEATSEQVTAPSDPSSTSQIHFQSIRESPLNTLGKGNLTLDAFLNVPSAKPADTRRPRALSPTNTSEIRKSVSARRIVSPNASTDNLADTKKMNRQQSAVSTEGAPLESTKSNVSYSEMEGDFDDDDDGDVKFSSEKRNREFHQLFKKVPTSEKLIDNFSCALSKDILVQGRMFLSKNYICFNSNILGWVTHLAIPLQEVIQIEKRSTAVLFPNGIVIRTLHQKYIFATFLSRDTTFAIIRNVWHQVLKDDNKLIRRKHRRSTDSTFSRQLEDFDSDDDGADVDDDNDDAGSAVSLKDIHNGDSEAISDSEAEEEFEDKPKNSENKAGDGDGKGFNGLPLVGPSSHAPTENGYTKQAGDTFICDENIKAPLGVVYNLLFGPDNSYYVKMLKEQKNFDVTDDTITELSQSKKERSYSYIKPLGGSIGPKQTKCLITDKLLEYDLEKSICVEVITQSPDVPSGNSFKVKSKLYFSWAANNTTKIYNVTSIEWTGKSWIKGAIEKGSIDGQKLSMKETVAFLNSIVSSGGSKSRKLSKKKSRSRSNTVSKRVESVKSKESIEPEEKSILDQFLSLVGAVGGLVPIPMIGETIVGFVIIISGFFILMALTNKIFFKPNSNSDFQVIPGDAFISRIKINNQDFMIMPTVETNLNNDKLRKEMEVSLWNWIEDRSNSKLSITTENNQSENKKPSHQDQILREVVEETETRLKKLSEDLKVKERLI